MTRLSRSALRSLAEVDVPMPSKSACSRANLRSRLPLWVVLRHCGAPATGRSIGAADGAAFTNLPPTLRGPVSGCHTPLTTAAIWEQTSPAGMVRAWPILEELRAGIPAARPVDCSRCQGVIQADDERRLEEFGTGPSARPYECRVCGERFGIFDFGSGSGQSLGPRTQRQPWAPWRPFGQAASQESKCHAWSLTDVQKPSM